VPVAPFLVLLVAAVAVTINVLKQRGLRQKLVGDGTLVALPSWVGISAVTSTAPFVKVHNERMRNGYWEATATLENWSRTGFTVSRRFIDSIAGLVGVKAISIGDASFDNDLTIHGDDPGIVRALCRTPAVRDALLDVFLMHAVVVRVKESGALSCRCDRRTEVQPDDGKKLADVVQKLVVALLENANVAPADHQLPASSTSGSSVGIPT
jgi:hypothetical protein